MASHSKEVAALGRPFKVGMLYDARTDQLIPGITLWDKETIQANTEEQAHATSSFDVCTSDSIKKKSSQLEMEASLQASFMSGLVGVEGSAKYLHDQKKFMNQSRVTCQYKATTSIKQLSMTPLQSETPQLEHVINKDLATHVVTGVIYGANSFFVFDSEKLEDSSLQEIQGSMEVMVRKIPSFSVKAKSKLTEEEYELTRNFSCRFYSDFPLDENPTTFEDVMVELPKLLQGTGKCGVPVKAWMLPLEIFNPASPKLEKEISTRLVRKFQDTLDDMKTLMMRCNDCLEDKVAKKFPEIHKKLQRFQNLCNAYTSKLQHTASKKLFSIRAGKLPEEEMENYLFARNKSQFSHKKLTRWMDYQEREINVVRSCVDTMDEIKIASNKNELDRAVLARGVDDALCFVFTSLRDADACLDAMDNYLDPRDSGGAAEDPWFYSDDVFVEMTQKAETFRDLAKALRNNRRFRFVVTSLPNKNHKGATIYHYSRGVLKSDSFMKPKVPDVKAVKDRRDLIWYACDLTLDPDTANNYLTLSDGNKKATSRMWQRQADHPARFDSQPQALCSEGLTGRHYWEVDWTNGYYDEVGVGVAYERISRKGGGALTRLGHNAVSWYFGHRYGLYAWHDGRQHCGPLPHDDCSRVGVFLDWPAGTLSFYRVSSNKLHHLHTFYADFTEPVHPGVWFWKSSFRFWQRSNYIVLSSFE